MNQLVPSLVSIALMLVFALVMMYVNLHSGSRVSKRLSYLLMWSSLLAAGLAIVLLVVDLL